MELRFHVPEAEGDVSALISLPEDVRLVYVLGHGAGAGMRHHFRERMSELLVARGVGTFRYQFPYMESGRKRPDVHRVLHGTVRAAVNAAADAAPGRPLIAGGKSMGGRMTSIAQAAEPLPGVVGLVFLGFPLHAPRKPAAERAVHLRDVAVPMLFLQGTRDSLAEVALVTQVAEGLGVRATMHIVEGGDHSFKVPKRSGRTEDEVFGELADTIDDWVSALA
ncbi:MAG: alpha/beta hydrolase [Gammaproteobacteria bacterium]|nr:MAG: alpha/beta hydrolase [Gammaproteobacteria bacterium]